MSRRSKRKHGTARDRRFDLVEVPVDPGRPECYPITMALPVWLSVYGSGGTIMTSRFRVDGIKRCLRGEGRPGKEPARGVESVGEGRVEADRRKEHKRAANERQ